MNAAVIINRMRFWCHSCAKEVEVTREFNCLSCNGGALEEVGESNNFIPFEMPEHEPQPVIVRTTHVIMASPPFGFNVFNDFLTNGVLMRTSMNQLHRDNPMVGFMNISFLPNIFGFNLGEEKVSVPLNVIEKLPKCQNLKEQCAICQEAGSNGIELPCKHTFHDKCIMPWFENKNTCPCCRAQVKQAC